MLGTMAQCGRNWKSCSIIWISITIGAVNLPRSHVIQLIVKAILGAFDIKPTETEYSDDDINGRSISSAIAKVSYQE